MTTRLQQQLVEMFHSAPIARLLGMRLSYDTLGRAHLHLPYNANLDHAMGGIHGGTLATLLDCAGWFTSAARHAGRWVSTSQLNVHLLEPARGCALQAEGWIVRRGERVDVAQMKVEGADGILYAVGTGTFVVAEETRLVDA